MGSVKQTSIYIEPDVDVALARRAAAEGTTKARAEQRDHAIEQAIADSDQRRRHKHIATTERYADYAPREAGV